MQTQRKRFASRLQHAGTEDSENGQGEKGLGSILAIGVE